MSILRRTFCFSLVATLLLITAHRLPAPISEEKTPPPEAPSKPDSAPAKHRSRNSPDSSPIKRFEGTWRTTKSLKNKSGTLNRTVIVIIKDSTVHLTGEVTSILIPGKKWNDLPAPYNSMSPIDRKWSSTATGIRMDGSNLRVQWPTIGLTDWSPKTIPLNLVQGKVTQPSTSIYILSGEQLIVTSGTGGSATYTRVR